MKMGGKNQRLVDAALRLQTPRTLCAMTEQPTAVKRYVPERLDAGRRGSPPLGVLSKKAVQVKHRFLLGVTDTVS